MKVSFSKVITKKWKSHLEVWVAKRHLHGWLLARPIYILLCLIFLNSLNPIIMLFCFCFIWLSEFL